MWITVEYRPQRFMETRSEVPSEVPRSEPEEGQDGTASKEREVAVRNKE